MIWLPGGRLEADLSDTLGRMDACQLGRPGERMAHWHFRAKRRGNGQS